MGDGTLRKFYSKFRLTTIVILLLQIAFLILFGFFVRYGEEGTPYTLSTTTTNWMNQTTHAMRSTPASAPTITKSPQLVDSSVTYDNNTNTTTSSTVVTTKFTGPEVAGNQTPPGFSPAESTTTENSGGDMNNEMSVEEKIAHVTHFYPMFQDIHVMMFIGFGFLMTFLKRYGFSSVGFNFLVAAFVLQWATLNDGWILNFDKEAKLIHVNMLTLINSDFCAAAILISFGAVLGKISSLQLIIMALIEVVAYMANQLFVFHFLKATDVGGSMVIHTFGAYFGLAVAWINYRKEVKEAEEKDGSVYHSDLFSMIGTIFLWLFWPSFNGATAADEGRMRAIINTYYSLTASCVVTFAMSALVQKDKFNMVHIQNSTLAGGVAIGTIADFIIQPWGAILVGGVSGFVSVLGFRYLTPFMSKRLKLHDTCGVNNLHGMPGIISGLGSILAAGIATEENYGAGLAKLFPAGGTQGHRAGMQAAALGVSLGMGLVCGAITGVLLRIPMWNKPAADEIFDDDQSWLLPDKDADESEEEQVGRYHPNRSSENYVNGVEMQHKDAHERL